MRNNEIYNSEVRKKVVRTCCGRVLKRKYGLMFSIFTE